MELTQRWADRVVVKLIRPDLHVSVSKCAATRARLAHRHRSGFVFTRNGSREWVCVSVCGRKELKDGNQRVSFAHTLHTPRSPSMTCRGVIAPPEPHAKSTDIKNPEITEGKKGNFV